jgi:hypothetical protein
MHQKTIKIEIITAERKFLSVVPTQEIQIFPLNQHWKEL